MYPKKIQIEITNSCNLRCKGCMRENMTREIGFMSINTFIKSINFATEFGIKEIHLHHWGEPLLHKNIIDYIIMAKGLHFTVGFTTNGSLLSIKKLKELKEAGLDKLDISYNKSISEIKHDLYFYSQEIGIETYFRSVVWSDKEYKELSKKLEGYNVRFQRGMYFDFNRRKGRVCKAIDIIFIINWDGIITPCCSMYDNQYTYGKVEKITVEKLKSRIDKLKIRIERQNIILDNCCNHCFEVDDNLPLTFKL